MITLWGRNNSTNVKKVRWVLEALELPYEQIQAGLEHGINNTDEYRQMNPNGLVPVISDDANQCVLWESNSIIRYLAAQYGRGVLWQEDPGLRAKAEMWMDWCNTVLSPCHRIILMGYVRTAPEERDQIELDAGVLACERTFALLDQALARQAWFTGDTFGLADITIAPFIYNLWNIGLKWQPRPDLERWYARLAELPEFQKVVAIPVT